MCVCVRLVGRAHQSHMYTHTCAWLPRLLTLLAFCSVDFAVMTFSSCLVLIYLLICGKQVQRFFVNFFFFYEGVCCPDEGGHGPDALPNIVWAEEGGGVPRLSGEVVCLA